MIRFLVFVSLVLIATAATACGEPEPAPAVPTSEPTATPTPVPPPQVLGSSSAISPDNPLIAEIKVRLDKEAAVHVIYEADGVGPVRSATTAEATEHVVPVLRLLPATTYSYRVVAMDSAGRQSEGGEGTFTTGDLPEALASIDFKAEGAPTAELIMMDYRENAGSYILILDRNSRIVWYYANPNPFPPARAGIQGIRQKSNFDLVFYMGSPRSPCCLVEITPLGEVVDRLVYNVLDDTPHHDHVVLPDNEVLYLAEETREIDDTAHGGETSTRVTGDVVRTWDQRSGTTREVWNSFDQISTDVRVVWSGATKRWTHFNSIQVGARGNIVVSSRNRNQVISINPDNRSVEWFLGGPNSTYTFPNPEDKFYRQHTATELPNGNILVFDNGADRPEEEGGEYSRALELALNDYESSATKVWEYRHQPDIFASFISSAYRLDNGNTLINFGTTPDV